jgi:excisionase family DNA binding protein
MGSLGKGLPKNTGLIKPLWVTLLGMELSINDAAKVLGVSPNTVRRRLTSGLIHGYKVGNQWLIHLPDTMETPPEPALASDKETLAIDNELVKQLRADLANSNDRITFLEGHISQLTNALSAAPTPKPRPWWRPW